MGSMGKYMGSVWEAYRKHWEGKLAEASKCFPYGAFGSVGKHMGSVGKPMGSMREALGSVFSSCLTGGLT